MEDNSISVIATRLRCRTVSCNYSLIKRPRPRCHAPSLLRTLQRSTR